MIITRRGFIGALLAAPAIVHAQNIMPVRLVTWSPPSNVDEVISMQWVAPGVVREVRRVANSFIERVRTVSNPMAASDPISFNVVESVINHRPRIIMPNKGFV